MASGGDDLAELSRMIRETTDAIEERMNRLEEGHVADVDKPTVLMRVQLLRDKLLNLNERKSKMEAVLCQSTGMQHQGCVYCVCAPALSAVWSACLLCVCHLWRACCGVSAGVCSVCAPCVCVCVC